MITLSPLATSPSQAIAVAAQHAPYLKRLAARHADATQLNAAEHLYLSALEQIQSLEGDLKQGESDLRRAKAQAHLAIAALDLSGQDTLTQTVFRLSELADNACQAALDLVARHQGVDLHGVCLIALGKMGAHELNYSSDIDLAAFIDPERFSAPQGEPVQVASRLVRDAMGLLNRQTADGYVFRTDLRLRPDPSSTPLAVSTRRAALYYESVGQNWERMVWIKARAAAGDLDTAQRFIASMQPFVWRQHLDYWAIADVQAIKNMINRRVSAGAINNPAADLKLGSGGIREIEFFVQTQQIILGGRNQQLRVRGTVDGLHALVGMGVVVPSVAEGLQTAYEALRQVEHRVQMVQDQQTHTLPADTERRADIAALCGYGTLQDFDDAVLETRRWVNDQYSKLFAKSGTSQHSISGNLVFTGVDDDPGTLETLTGLGFTDPSSIIARIRRWHHGKTLATRSRRGRELLTTLLPDLLTLMSKMGDPSAAFARFSRFFEGLRSGVQTLSMLAAEPKLFEDLVATLALAPRIADTLARRPALLESLLLVSDQAPAFSLAPDADFETSINLMRRWHAAESFALGHRLLQGQIEARTAAAAWTKLADICIERMTLAAQRETTRKFGPQPGRFVVAGLGKLGGEDMTASSDLDIIIVFDPQGASEAQSWYTRFTQRLITALSAETAEGALYEVDMRLRPSGRAGPVATSLTAFQRYHAEDAWTWEHMALTRLRPVSGDASLGTDLIRTAQNTRTVRPSETVTADILAMRQRLYRDKPPQGDWDLKQRPGGLIDIEFIVQQGLLQRSDMVHTPRLSDALEQLFADGHFTPQDSEILTTTYRFLQSLQQVQRLAFSRPMQRDDITPGLADRFCRATAFAAFETVETELQRRCEAVSDIFCKKIGDPATD